MKKVIKEGHMKYSNHQLIGTEVEHEGARCVVTGAVKAQRAVNFRLLRLSDRVEYWTEAGPIFGEIRFPNFRSNRALAEAFAEPKVKIVHFFDEPSAPDQAEANASTLNTPLNPPLFFVEECCELGIPYHESTVGLWRAFLAWCRENGYRPLGRNCFYDHLVMNFPSIMRTVFDDIRSFRGIQLNEKGRGYVERSL
jgi:hypothetical protein